MEALDFFGCNLRCRAHHRRTLKASRRGVRDDPSGLFWAQAPTLCKAIAFRAPCIVDNIGHIIDNIGHRKRMYSIQYKDCWAVTFRTREVQVGSLYLRGLLGP